MKVLNGVQLQEEPTQKTALQGVLYNTPHTKEVALLYVCKCACVSARSRVHTCNSKPTLIRSQSIRLLDNPDWQIWRILFAGRTLIDTCGLVRQMSHSALMTAQNETEHALHCCQVFFLFNRTNTMAYNASFAHLTEAEIAADVVRLRLWLKDQIMDHGNPQLRKSFLAP